MADATHPEATLADQLTHNAAGACARGRPEENAAVTEQLATFSRAVDLLGGIRATATALSVSERTIRYLLVGEKPLHRGWLEDISRLLLDHADTARALEKRLNPLFAGNLLPGQERYSPLDQRPSRKQGRDQDHG